MSDWKVAALGLSIWCVFLLLDVGAYLYAKYPERTRSRLYAMIPGGGFVALLKFGRQR